MVNSAGYNFRAIETLQSKVNDVAACPISPGQYIICVDSGSVYYDTSNYIRKPLKDIIDLESDAERNGILAPLDKLYFVKETAHFWRYLGSKWIDLTLIAKNESIGNSTVLSADQPTGQKANDEWLEIIAVE